MLSDNKRTLLNQLIRDFTPEEIIYTKGFFDGYLGAKAQPITSPENLANTVVSSVKSLIVYATETGNSKKVAIQLLKNFKQEKIQARTIDISQFSWSQLKKEEVVFFVISTQGEGDLPETAISFVEELRNTSESLDQLRYAVLGLGDSSYPLFCSAGVLLDEILDQKKAARILPLVKADVDYQTDVIGWSQQLVAFLKQQVQAPVAGSNEVVTQKTSKRKKNYTGIIQHKVILNDTGANKQTYHLEITPNEEVDYEPGDSLGVIPKNKKEEILQVLDILKVDENQRIQVNAQEKTGYQWLEVLNIKGLSKKTLDKIAGILAVEHTLEKADLFDFLQQHKSKTTLDSQKILEVLLPIAPRLYSISSSKDAHDGQVHLTVALNTFSVNGVAKKGLASDYLADYPLNTDLEFYIDHNAHFKLPEDDKDIIMIGPGTGIAPFRSFIAERDSRAADGKNWLFFGEQHFVYDFYYQTEIQEWLSTGALTKLSTAFSRDQAKKIYVQDRIREQAKTFLQWLDNGAYLYICGQKNPMSKDVENTLIEILIEEKNISQEQAQHYLENLESEGRYHKDVY